MVLFAAEFVPHKIVSLHGFYISGATFIIPFWYLLGDIITEIYGYSFCRFLTWSSIAIITILSLLLTSIIHFPSPDKWLYQAHYNYIINPLLRITIASAVGCYIGGISNAFLLAKWRVLVKGKYFWLRSIGASSLGQGIYILIGMPMIFLGTMPPLRILQVMLASLVIKVIITAIGSGPAAALVFYLKRRFKLRYTNNLDFNPFLQTRDDQ